MKQRIRSLAQSGAPRRTLKARKLALQAAADVAPRCAMDRAWSAGYMMVSLLAIAAACAVAVGETASAELQFATVVIGTGPLAQNICAAGGTPHPRALKLTRHAPAPLLMGTTPLAHVESHPSPPIDFFGTSEGRVPAVLALCIPHGV